MGILLVEDINRAIEVITEEVNDGTKKYKIHGIMMESEIKNKNGRKYPKTVMENAIKVYNEEKIKTNRAWGQLEHCQDPQIHLDRVSHLLSKLEMKGNDGYGEGELLEDTPMGRIAIALTKHGVIGTSTRGVGTMQPDGTVDDGFSLCAVDLVADPSASRSIIQTVREAKEWIIGPDGIFVEAAIDNLIAATDKKFTQVSASAAMNEFLAEVNSKLKLRRML
jgi:hypothetical protein